MILPTTYSATLLLLILSMICWGSWANTLKLTGSRWRFELFYFDYSFGVLIACVIAAFTFGSVGTDLTFQDRMLVAGHLKEMYVFAGGVVFNLANMLLVGAIALAGMAVAFPVGIGLALIIGVVWNYIIDPQGNPVLLFAGLALVICAVIVDAVAHRARDRAVTAAAVPTTKKAKKSTTTKGLVISIVSGVLMGTFYPLVEKGMGGEMGLGAYASALFFALGVFFSTFFFNVIFMNVPLQGERIRFKSYFRGHPKWHFLGIAGGIIWAVGAIANFLGATTPPNVNVGPAISLAIGQCATLISVLWGLLVWKEFAGTPSRVKLLLGIMIGLFAAGLVLLSLAPIVGRT
jgi:glucose uptake protein